MRIPSVLAITVAIVWAGKIQEGDKIPGRVILGMAVLLIFLTALSTADENLAFLLSVAVLLGAVYRYGPRLFASVS